MSYNKTKTDPVLGKQVHDHLVSLGVETPLIDNSLSRTEKIEIIEKKKDIFFKHKGLILMMIVLWIVQNVLQKCM